MQVILIGIAALVILVMALDFLFKSPIFLWISLIAFIGGVLYFFYNKHREKILLEKSIQTHLRLKNQEMERALAIIENPIPQVIDVVDTHEIVVIDLTEEEKIANLEKEAALAERATEALLKKREATRKLKKAQDEDAIEAVRLQRQLDKEKNPPPPPPPPMTQDEKMKALEALKERENAEVERLRALGYEEDSNAIDDVRAFYAKELKILLNTTRYAK